ncbi:MAG: glucan biosynthesis protein G [Cohaesibacteraceae bacterium]|nr:glucan biosynthesis protein G [Cohaesibacteraceae bacterium]
MQVTPFGAMAATGGSVSLPFTDSTVRDIAFAMSKKHYMPRPLVPQAWQNLDYNQYREIKPRLDQAIWSGANREFSAQPFAPGSYFKQAVALHTVENGQAKQIPFARDLFERGKLVPDLPDDSNLGFSGFRLRTPLNNLDIHDEFLVFQGASYFRAIGKGHWYGLSARGLAIDTAEPTGEEFPDFCGFWLETPKPGATTIRVHALLDSPRTTGAYIFDIVPGSTTEMEVSASLFPRQDLEHVGIAPLTSMFLYNGIDRSRFDDFRPSVHDSDGLLIDNGAGERLWRPLANPRNLQISAFMDNNPRGFGLMQRARRFDQFTDLEARYEKRPSLWVTPLAPWGKGSVTLVEIPTAKEINDNIVAYWRPEKPLKAGEEHQISYRLSWCWDAPGEAPLAKVTGTRMGARGEDGRLAVIDFEPHNAIPVDVSDIKADYSSWPQNAIRSHVLEHNRETGGTRLAMTFAASPDKHAELRVQLRDASLKPLSEVWLYRWTA